MVSKVFFFDNDMVENTQRFTPTLILIFWTNERAGFATKDSRNPWNPDASKQRVYQQKSSKY
jgi:hypothetical protein